MKVTIRLVGVFRVGRFKEAVREYPPATSVREVVDGLEISHFLLGAVLINDVHASVDNSLHEGDRLCLLPFMDGG